MDTKQKLQKTVTDVLKLIESGNKSKAIEKIWAFKGEEKTDRFILIRMLISYAQQKGSYDVARTALDAFERIKKDTPKDASLYYDIANGYQVLFELTTKNNFLKVYECVDIVKNAINYFEKALSNNPNAYTNFGNLYDSIGRPIDAIDYYEKALNFDKDFGMALGNMALALERLSRVSGYEIVYLIYAYQLYQTALENEVSIKESGGVSAIEAFRNHADKITNYFKKIGKEELLKKDLTHEHYDETKLSPFVKFYTDFCVKNNLYVNLHRSDKASESSIKDSMFPVLRTGNEAKEEQYVKDIAFRFNEISESYMTARMALVQSQYANSDFSTVSEQTTLINNLDYSVSNIYVGHLKTAYKEVFSTLDRIAILINHYLELGHPEDSVYYGTVWFEKQPYGSKEKPTLLQKVRNEPWLFGLYLLCQELYASEYSNMRNALTHRYVRVYKAVDGPKGTYNFEQLTDLTLEVFYKVRCAIMYLSLFISRKELQKNKDSKGAINMPLFTNQDLDIWDKI